MKLTESPETLLGRSVALVIHFGGQPQTFAFPNQLINKRHSRAGWNPEGCGKRDALPIWPCDNNDIELRNGPSMGRARACPGLEPGVRGNRNPCHRQSHPLSPPWERVRAIPGREPGMRGNRNPCHRQSHPLSPTWERVRRGGIRRGIRGLGHPLRRPTPNLRLPQPTHQLTSFPRNPPPPSFPHHPVIPAHAGNQNKAKLNRYHPFRETKGALNGARNATERGTPPLPPLFA